MALTLNSSPDGNQFNDVVYYKVTSNTGTILKVICDVYLEGVYVLTLEKYPILGTTNEFEFNLSSVILGEFTTENIGNYLTNYPNGTLGKATTSSKINICKFYEVTTAGATAWLPAGAGTADLTTTNKRLHHGQKFTEKENITDFKTGIYGAFSRRPKTVAQRYNPDAPLCFSAYSSTLANTTARFREYDVAGNIIATTNVTVSDQNQKFHFTTGKTLLGNTSFVSITLEASTLQSAEIFYKPVKVCTDHVTLYWQNSVGGFDFYLLDGSVEFLNENKRDYYKIAKSPRPSVTWDNNFELLSYNNQNNRYIEATSRIVGREEAKLFADIPTGNGKAWIWDVESASMIPVIIDDLKVKRLSSFNGEYKLQIRLLYSTNLKGGRF
jgi:hypothetical protein